MMSASAARGWVTAERSETLSASRDALWALLSDTERLNRELHLPAVDSVFAPRLDGGATLRASATFGPLTVRYTEEPYTWTRPERWSVRRLTENGPARELVIGMRLEAVAPDRTRLIATAAAQPRGAAGSWLCGRIAESCVDGLLRAARVFALHLSGDSTTPYPRTHGRPVADNVRLGRACDTLIESGVAPELAHKIAEYAAVASPDEARRLRPYALADRWGVSRLAALDAFLLGVRAGLLELKWRLLCPSCRGAGGEEASLADLSLKGDAHCESCAITFGPEFDRNIEVVFSVSPAIRPLGGTAATWCRSGPHQAPHVVAQTYLHPGERETLLSNAPAARLVARSPQGKARLELPPDTTDTTIVWRGGTLYLDEPSGPGIVARNDGDTAALICLETPGWVADAATAAEVTARSAFRAHFGSEVLSPGMEVAVRQVTLLFTDVKGSTALYARQGDAPSYAAVRDHFTFLTARIDAAGGGVLKTIGDAVMAAFPDPADALSAVLAIQRDAPGSLNGLVLKAGLHAGPALAVIENGRVDYFGHTVNVAARLQSHSLGGDLVVLASMLDDPSVAHAAQSAHIDPFDATLRGATGPVRLLRLTAP